MLHFKQRRRSIFRIGGGGAKFRKMPFVFGALRTQSHNIKLIYKTERAAKMKIVYV